MIVISSGEVSSGIGKVSSGGSFLYFESIDELYVLSGGIAEDTTVSGEISWDGEIYGGNMYVNRGGVANGTDVADGFLTISSGGIANNTTLHYGYMTILKGGIANSNDLYYSGSMYVCSGGTANVNSVDNHGWLSVGNGGVASNTTVNAEGFIIVEGGGTATDITMMSKAHLRATIAPDTFLKGTSLGSAFLIENGYVSHFQINSGNSISVMSGVSAEDIAVNNQGYFSVASGGTAINVNVVNGGRLNVTVAPDTYIQGTFGGREFLVDNGHVSGYAVSSGVSLVISAGRSATDIAVKSGGRMLVSSGGSAVNVIVDNGGVLDVAIAPNTYIQGTSGGVEFLVANNFVSRFTIASRGSLAISQGHSATDLTVKSGGTLFVYSGGTATGLTVSNGGVLIATVAQDTYIQGTSDGSAFRVDNGYVSGYNIAGWGDRLHVSSGGTAENTMIANGSMYVNGNGLANETVVQGRGGLFVKDSGTASNTTVNYGTLHVYSGGSAENVQVNLGGSISVYSGGQVSELIENGGFVEIADGAEVIFKSNTIAKLEIGEDQSATLHSNTTAVNVIVHESGSLYVENGGKALNIIENGGYVSCAADADVAFVPNVISGLFLLNEAASATLHSGTTAVDLELFGGRLDVFRGGVAENTTLDFDTADDYWEGGYMMVHSGGLAKNTEIKDDSVLNIRNGGVATGTTVQGGYFWVGSGASAASTTVSYGIIGVLSGGTATGLAIMSDGSLEATVAPDTYIQGTSAGSAFLFDNGYVSGYTIAGWGGRLDVSSGGTALDITVTSRGNLSVSSGGTAANIQVQRGGGLDIVVAPDTYVQGVSAGAALLLENGLLSDYTVENGSMSIIGGGTASSIMVNSGGRLFVSSNGTLKQAAINFAGSLTVSGGGTLEQATVNSSASLFVSSGGTATGITMESGAYLSVVVAPDTLIQAVSAGRAINVKDGIAIGLTVESGRIDVRSGGLVDNTTVCSNYLDVNNGGVASNTMVENGSMYVSSGGFAVNTTVHAAGRVYVNGGVTSDNWIQANGMMYINWEGAVASGTVVDANGSLVVSSGGTANKTVLLENGVLFNRSGGLVTNLQLHSGARIDSLLENTGDDIAQISVLSGNVAYEVVSGGVWKGELMVGKDTQVTGVAGAFTLKTVESGSCTVTGSDLSQVEFSLEPGSVVNLSGNYFGTTDIDAIYKTYGFSRDSIIIDDVLLTNPTTSFNVTVSGLKQNTFGLDTRTLTLLFSHDVDETTVTDNSFQLISPDGTPVSITSWSLSGKTLKLNFESLAEEGRYKLLFADAIKDVNGDVLESIHSSSASAEGWAELLTLRADFTPLRVVSISPEGDFAGTLKEFRVTFSEAVDRTNVAKNVILTGPNGMDIEPSSFTIANGTAVFTLSPQIAYGQYTITVLPEMSDLAGNMLDQNNNGMPDEAADEFTANFTIADVDLKVSEVQLSSSELMPGESLTVSWKDYNNGGFALV
ncbi:MAG: AIDA repeat-containing protein, partial [Victivallales bacterium]|nr:AIDA repeat-containing protein [Victivallales bacterium]